MSEVLAVSGDADAEVHAVAAAMAAIMGADIRQTPAGARAAAGVLRELARPPVALGVLARDTPPADLAWRVACGSAKPVILVPKGGRAIADISRVLLPLDGTAESAAAVAETVAVLTGAGVDLVALHVFDRSTVPAFWDQAAHTRDTWQQEFLSRYCGEQPAGLRLRSGAAGDHVVDVAADEDVDLIALGWSRRGEAGRARTVRHTIAAATVPVLLVPMPLG